MSNLCYNEVDLFHNLIYVNPFNNQVDNAVWRVRPTTGLATGDGYTQVILQIATKHVLKQYYVYNFSVSKNIRMLEVNAVGNCRSLIPGSDIVTPGSLIHSYIFKIAVGCLADYLGNCRSSLIVIHLFSSQSKTYKKN